MPQKYIVYFNQKSIVFNNLTPDYVRNLPIHLLIGQGIETVDNALKLLENEKDEKACIYLQDISWEEGIALLKTCFTFIRAAGGLIQNHDLNYLLIHRLGQWDLPKGKIEKSESDELAARREIEEETGIQVIEPLTFLCSTWHTYTQKGTSYLKETVWFTGKAMHDSAPVAQREEAIESAIWCAEIETREKLNESYPSIADVWSAWNEF